MLLCLVCLTLLASFFLPSARLACETRCQQHDATAIYVLHNTHTGWSETEREHLGQEMSDILIYLVRLAEQCRVDLPTAVTKKFTLNAEKYPAHKAYGSMRKYTAYTSDSSSEQ